MRWHVAAGAVLEQARELAASLLEADPADIVVDDGLVVVGVPGQGLTLAELAAAAPQRGTPLAASPGFRQNGSTFPFGAHVAVVEVDVETGLVTPVL